jgi:hypothetical protein
MEEKPAINVSIREARDVGAPATLDSFTPTARERKRRRKEILDDGGTSGLLEMSALKEGVVVTVEE